MRVRFLAVVEVHIDHDVENPEACAQAKLDAFREETGPTINYGISIWRARPEDRAALKSCAFTVTDSPGSN